MRSALSGGLADGLKAGKEETKPLLILFMDTGPKSKQWTQILADKSLDDDFGKIVYVAVEFKKGGDDEKKYSVTSSPTLVLVDPTKDDAKPKKISSPAPASLKRELETAIKALMKK